MTDLALTSDAPATKSPFAKRTSDRDIRGIVTRAYDAELPDYATKPAGWKNAAEGRLHIIADRAGIKMRQVQNDLIRDAFNRNQKTRYGPGHSQHERSNNVSTKKIITEIAEEVKVEYGYGFKFLTPFGTTESEQHGSFEYNLPQRGQKWSDVTAHPDPMLVTDSSDCGTGRLHVMNKLSANYAPRHWWPWFVRFDKAHIVGSSLEKTGVRALQLRRIRPAVFHRYIKFGYCRGANLSNANLSNADLSYADLSNADLSNANLSYADLSNADLSGTDLSYANLSGANLRGANLRGADLSGADLSYADLSYADLSGADLRGADLRGANLSYADLRGADLRGADLRGARNKELAIGLVEPEPLKSDSSDDDEEDEEDH